ncbi:MULTISPECIES: carbohydrate ABC transporter permease [Micromonospora]|uniref:Sugar ABC transporter permease n=1 Tax=Micromonospora aurantiaca (nom. illeg.) TaxID=47850 RepID=A0A3M9KCW3_9ACTN|nr:MULTISPECIES: sugar ABC transporter permease [Micromonospora]ADL47691.1 binding-protein-dependent transport systems inner membrane component [Micromonospora aurantiaca ATCC 27029]ADU09634.1 binding-protein-dependent transport systems inner membrane component [Micromonospora sp. L5]AXH93767.1 sugar ABC transporter permease [Micromonospora aurantiaca]KAB1109701.1 sugar ABC transporter permease [Micromonospora aurantiaca]MDG4752966.1 sugar ABC transporter permease [Micromonospora sp. WMMD718]
MSVNATPAGAQAAAEAEAEQPGGRHAAVPEQRSRRGSRAPLSDNKRAERRLGLLLCAPAALVMVLVTAYPILYSVWLSLQRFDLRFPDEREFVGLENYVTVLTNDFWWTAFGVTALITVVTVAVELVLGMGLALIMHRTLVGRGIVRTAALIPYGIVTVVAAFSWRYAWTPGTGYLANLFDGSAPLTERASSLAIIMLAEIWKTTPFMALLLMAGLALVPEDLLKAASTDGATAWQRFTKVMLPVMKPAILVALLFRTLDAFRVFDNIFVLTNGGNETSSVSMLAYNNLIRGLNLGIGSTMSVLIFITVAIIAFVFVKLFGTAAPGSDDGERR